MTSLWIIFVILNVASVGFVLITLRRFYNYIKRHRFDESKYTLLFGFVHLRWIAALYLVMVLLWIPLSFGIFTSL